MDSRVAARGIDISHWQPLLSRDLIRKYALEFVAIKATEGRSYSDPKFSTNWARAHRYGIWRAAYHFARPEQSSGVHQAKRLVDRAKPQPGDALLLDLEASDLTQARTRAWRDDFAAYCRKHARGISLHIYMGLGYCTNGTGRDAADHFDAQWFPRYPSRTTFPTSVNPDYPASARANTGFTSGPHVWQFTDRLGGGPLDGDVSRVPTSVLFEAKDTSMYNSVSTGRHALEPGRWNTIPWDTVYAGPTKVGNPGIVFGSQTGRYRVGVAYELSGLPDGEVFYVRLVEVVPDGDGWKVVDVIAMDKRAAVTAAEDKTKVEHQYGMLGREADTQGEKSRVWFQVYPAATAGYLERATAKASD